MVLAHLRKEIFPKGEYNKPKIKNIGPCRILRKFLENSYELEMPIGVGISPIFNVVNLYTYEAGDTRHLTKDEDPIEDLWWMK